MARFRIARVGRQQAPEVDVEIKRLDTVWIIVQASTGYDMIDDEAATEAGIMVANLPFQCLHEVANSALGYILTLNRRLVDADRHVRAGGWDRFGFMPIG